MPLSCQPVNYLGSFRAGLKQKNVTHDPLSERFLSAIDHKGCCRISTLAGIYDADTK